MSEPTPKRRWLQFSLRTLLIVTAICCLVTWVIRGNQLAIERHRLLSTDGISYELIVPRLWGQHATPLNCYLCDGPSVSEIAVGAQVPEAACERLRTVFHEAYVHRDSGGKHLTYQRDGGRTRIVQD